MFGGSHQGFVKNSMNYEQTEDNEYRKRQTIISEGCNMVTCFLLFFFRITRN